MPKKKKARVKYYSNYHNKFKDGFAVELLTGYEWGLDAFYPCHAKEENGETDYIHFSLLTHIKNLVSMNYDVEIL